MMKQVARFVIVFLVSAVAAVPLVSRPAGAAELIMFERPGCEWCEEWDAVIAPIYPMTAEGRKAPLRRVNVHAPLPSDIAHINPGPYTPTFVVVDGGRELGRIRGYPGEDFFWGLLAEIVSALPDQISENAALGD